MALPSPLQPLLLRRSWSIVFMRPNYSSANHINTMSSVICSGLLVPRSPNPFSRASTTQGVRWVLRIKVARHPCHSISCAGWAGLVRSKCSSEARFSEMVHWAKKLAAIKLLTRWCEPGGLNSRDLRLNYSSHKEVQLQISEFSFFRAKRFKSFWFREWKYFSWISLWLFQTKCFQNSHCLKGQRVVTTMSSQAVHGHVGFRVITRWFACIVQCLGHAAVSPKWPMCLEGSCRIQDLNTSRITCIIP